MSIIVAILAGAAIVGAAAYYFLVSNRGTVYERALAMAERGEYTDARGLIRTKLDRDPDDFKAHYQLAKIYALEGNEESELTHLEQVRRINRYSAEMGPGMVLNRMGSIHYAAGRYSDAYQCFFEAHNFNSNDEQCLVYLGFLAVGQEEFDLAEGYLRRLTALAPNVAEYHLARGVSLAMINGKDALAELETGLALNPHDTTAKFLIALHAFRLPDVEKAKEQLESLLQNIPDPDIGHLANRLAVGIYYLDKDYDQALAFAERCLSHSINQGWGREEHDARLSIAYMAMLTSDLEKAGDNLIELEMRNPSDELILRVSDFRMDLEEGVTTIDRVSPRGFDLFSHLQDWMRNRFPGDAIFKLSGLEMEEKFDVMSLHAKDQQPQRTDRAAAGPDPDELIARFNELKGPAFQSACETIIALQGFAIEKELPYREKDGADFIARNQEDRKIRALVRIRQWANEPISDIFVRNMQNTMNELKVTLGFVIAGARLTTGAESALENLKKITVINERDFGSLLQQVLK